MSMSCGLGSQYVSSGGSNNFRIGTQRQSPNSNFYLATRLDHPTVFDFEDWHTSLDKRKSLKNNLYFLECFCT